MTDIGLQKLLGGATSTNLVAMDLSDITNVSDATILQIANRCPKLQGLNLSMCKDGHEYFRGVTDTSIVKLAEQCPGLRKASDISMSFSRMRDALTFVHVRIDQVEQLLRSH